MNLLRRIFCTKPNYTTYLEALSDAIVRLPEMRRRRDSLFLGDDPKPEIYWTDEQLVEAYSCLTKYNGTERNLLKLLVSLHADATSSNQRVIAYLMEDIIVRLTVSGDLMWRTGIINRYCLSGSICMNEKIKIYFEDGGICGSFPYCRIYGKDIELNHSRIFTAISSKEDPGYELGYNWI